MPEATIIIAALVLGTAAGVTVLWRKIKGLEKGQADLRRDISEKQQDIAKRESRIREMLGDDERPHLRVIHGVALLVGIAAWLKRYAVPVSAASATAGAVGLAVLVPAPAQGDLAWPEPVPPTPSSRGVSVVAPVSTATARLPAPTREVARPTRSAPPPAEVTPRVPSPSSSRIPSPVPTTTSLPAVPPELPTPDQCVVGLGLLGLDVCVGLTESKARYLGNGRVSVHRIYTLGLHA